MPIDTVDLMGVLLPAPARPLLRSLRFAAAVAGNQDRDHRAAAGVQHAAGQARVLLFHRCTAGNHGGQAGGVAVLC